MPFCVGTYHVWYGAEFSFAYSEREWPPHSEMVRVADEALLAFCSGGVIECHCVKQEKCFWQCSGKKEDLAEN